MFENMFFVNSEHVGMGWCPPQKKQKNKQTNKQTEQQQNITISIERGGKQVQVEEILPNSLQRISLLLQQAFIWIGGVGSLFLILVGIGSIVFLLQSLHFIRILSYMVSFIVQLNSGISCL